MTAAIWLFRQQNGLSLAKQKKIHKRPVFFGGLLWYRKR